MIGFCKYKQIRCTLINKGTVKPVLRGHQKRSQKLVFKNDYRFMQVKSLQNALAKSIAECSKRAFCNTFDLY